MKRRDFLIRSAGLVAAVPALSRVQAKPCPPPSLNVSGGTSATTECVNTPASAPSWFVEMPEKTWATPVINTLSSVKPNPLPPGAGGQVDVCLAWTGACSDQARGEYLLPAQGGHNGYYGNEIYAVALREAEPAWKRIWGPTPNDQIQQTNLGYNPSNTSYSDGSPRPIHGWYQQLATVDGRIWLAGAGGYANPNGDWGTTVYSIDRGALQNGWTYHGRLYTAIPGGRAGSTFGFQSGPGAYDRVANKIWRAGDFATANGISSIDVAAAAAAGPANPSTGPAVAGSKIYNVPLTGSSTFSDAWSVVTHDTSPRCWIVGATKPGLLWIMDLENDRGVIVQSSTSGSPDGFSGGVGAAYHAPSRAILVGGSEYGASIRKLSIQGSNPLTATYSWSTIEPAAGNTVTPGSPGGYQGTFSKFQMIEDMGDGCAALVMVTSVTGPVYIYKLPAGGLS